MAFRRLDDLEVRTLDPPKLAVHRQNTRIWCNGDRPVQAVVGNEHPMPNAGWMPLTRNSSSVVGVFMPAIGSESR